MIPIKYNVRSLFVRKANTLMTIVSIAFVVLVYVGVLALGAGLRVAFTASGDNSTVIVLRDGSSSEMESYFPTETHRILASLPGVARNADGEPLASGETMTLQILERLDGSETNAVLRGVEDDAFALRPYIQIAEGRRFVPGQTEIIVGDQLEGEVGDLELGSTIDLGRFTFTVVGVFDSGGSSYGSEIWGNVQEFGRCLPTPELLLLHAPEGRVPGTGRGPDRRDRKLPADRRGREGRARLFRSAEHCLQRSISVAG